MSNQIIYIFGIIFLVQIAGALKAGECEVCIKFLKKLEQQLPKTRDPKNVEPELIAICKTAKGKELRFCQYIGATENAATKITSSVVRPLSFYKDVEKICGDLKKKDSQICELAYDKEIDWNNINLKKMRVKELKKILRNWDEICDGCVEKSDYIRRIEELKPKYVDSAKTEL